ncbi:hypothetical protein OPV22_032358 [Ensete ventricosum]|uniref:Uncharacterized protein n=1 Tax=Ensete ventricosum TaxID=4639 RepID=A0AAV8PWD6_ENSVE|nr:hypothetical protein OPV22_032358 [Ensete ventricosum]
MGSQLRRKTHPVFTASVFASASALGSLVLKSEVIGHEKPSFLSAIELSNSYEQLLLIVHSNLLENGQYSTVLWGTAP